ncbi:carbamoyltransferase family protein [Candidatus Pelagibacter sp. HIMB1517]|uniref:carbamoyltransferase family protein n=1 Tax=Candidatus Pelagibacter sp. HIMB1517 TaxID=3413341 RepID=UPI003F8796F8
MTSVLGISCYYHDSAAALLIDGKILGAAQEERFTRKKHDARFPVNSINFLLNEFKLKLSDVDYVVFYEKPFLKFERLLETYLAFAPKGFSSFSMSMPVWLKEKLFQKKNLINELSKIDKNFDKKIYFSEHHLSHASSAFFSSNFKKSIILTLDGVGEWATTTISEGIDNKIKILKEINFPHSIGLLYSAFTYFLGFKVNSGEYKMMGLAPYGEPKFKKIILDHLIDLKDDGSFRLDMKFFDFATGKKMTNKKFSKLFGIKRRKPENKLEQKHMDIAASIQEVTEDIVLKICRYMSKNYPNSNLCLSGGVALNCVANGKIIKEKLFKNVFIQPASGDAGGALGAAQALYFLELKNKRVIDSKEDDAMQGSYLGCKFEINDIEKKLIFLKAKYHKLDYLDIISQTASLLSEKKAIGWFQGKMEFGPRALGNRSIIADPRPIDAQKNLNLKIKFRESFRPFAPAILEEKVSEYFDHVYISPYMLLVDKIKEELRIYPEVSSNKFGIDKLNQKRSNVPSITHVDYSSRIQTVSKKTNKPFHDLLSKFYEITDCPILVNTSFNVRGEPIVCSPEDAYNCFMGTNLDVLVIENFLLFKEEQDPSLVTDYKNKYNLD